MNVLEQLRDDMCEAGIEADAMGEEVIDACVEVLDEFIAAHEAVEVDAFERDSGAPRRWFVPVDVPYISGDPPRKQTIIVPRKQEPSLLEAAKAVEEWCRYTNYWRGMPVELHEKCDALAAAIKKAEVQGD